MEVPVTLFRVYLGMVTSFRARLCWLDVTFHGIYIVPAEILYYWCQLCTYGPP